MNDVPKATGRELVARKTQTNDIATLVQRQAPAFRAALGKTVDPEVFVRTALTTLRTTPGLAECKRESVLGALMLSAQLGLVPGPLGEAYLVPFGRECTFIVGYQGLMKLAYNSGKVTSIYAEMIHENDHFQVVRGTDRKLIHEEPKPFGSPRGKVIGVYAVAKLAGAAEPQFVVLTFDEVERFRQMSRGKNSMMWKDHWEAAARKTAVRQLAKWIPKSVELQRAIAADDAAEEGKDQAAAAGFDFGDLSGDDEPTVVVVERDPDTGEVLPPMDHA